MTQQELYIDDTRIDLDKDAGIYLLYQSPLFTDLKSIVSNRSYNISIPATDNNLRAIEHVHMADTRDAPGEEETYTFPRKWHNVKYYRNGIAITERGRGALISVDKGRINFAFSWGNVENFQKLFDKKLTEITVTDAATASASYHIKWSNNTIALNRRIGQPEPFLDYGFYVVDFGQGINGAIQYIHPSVKVQWIVDRILEDNGIEMTDEDKNRICKSYLIPLVTKKSSLASNMSQGINATGGVLWELGLIPRKLYWNPNDSTSGCNVHIEVNDIRLNNTEEIHINFPSFTIEGPADGTYEPCYRIGNKKLCEPYEIERMTTYIPPRELFVYPARDMDVRVEEITDEENGTFRICLMDRCEIGMAIYDEQPPHMQIYPTDQEECTFGGEYDTMFPIVPNLPDMKQSDFIKALMQMSGVFAYVKTDNTISLTSVNDIIQNKSIAYDWTNNLFNESAIFDAPVHVEFKLDEFAQNNVFAYKKDDDDPYTGSNPDGVLVVEDETIGVTKESVTLPFSASNNKLRIGDGFNGDGAYMRIGAYNQDEEGNVEFREVQPRIGNVAWNPNYGPEYRGQFNSAFKNMLSQPNFLEYQNIIRRPRVLKVECLISDLELSRLDLTVPVWFDQFGHYYAIIKLQSASDGICSCDLLQLPEG